MTTVERISELLAKRNISAAKMMRELGFSNGLYSQWKSGKQQPSTEKLQRIAAYLDVSTDYLLGIQPEQPDAVVEELLILARRTKELPESERRKLMALLRGTINTFLEAENQDD